MTKKTKILLVVIIMMISLIILGIKVFAESTTYTSYLNMLAGNTTLKGSTRQYNQRNHSISLTITQLPVTGKMYMELVKDGFFSDTTVSYKDNIDIVQLKTYSFYMGNYDTGKYYYYFSTFGNPTAFYANPVNMTCYD